MEDYYSDNPDGAGEPMAEDTKDQGEQTALLPKSILMGKEFKPGDEIILKIDAIHEDEVSVSYAEEKKPEKMPAKPDAAPMKEADPSMAGLYD